MGALKLMSGKCIIFAGAEVKDISSLDIDNETYIICADGGYKNALKFGIIPNLAVGDFDTLDFKEVKECKIIKCPPEKDDTDTMIAVKKALEMGFDDITITGALGGRFDHTFANIQTLLYIAENNADGCIIGDNDIIYVQKNSCRTYHKKDGYYFSVFSLSGLSEGVTLKGFKYNLENGVLKNSFPLGVSNEFAEKNGFVEVKNGILLVILSKNMNLL